jgi:hypothetical protein
MPSHIEEALELVALAFTTAVSIAVAFIVEQPCAVEWRSASELLPSEQLELTELIAAGIPIDRANCCRTAPTHWRICSRCGWGHVIDKSKR